MAYDALAINVFSEKKEDALRFLDCAAAIGWKGNGKEEGKETGAIRPLPAMQMRNISELLWATIQRISGAGGS